MTFKLKPHPQFVPPKLILDSTNRYERLTTFSLRYPKFVHGELMTHRVFSRNASSSRAIPTSKLSISTADDIYIPQFRENRAGMQPGDYLSPGNQEAAAMLWEYAAKTCLDVADQLGKIGVHKQWSNRMLEWFGYINVLVSATSWKNFVALRTELDDLGYPMAQDEIMWQAEAIEQILAESKPKLLAEGEWHLPFIEDDDRELYESHTLRKISSARCASISYKTVDDKFIDYDRAQAIFAKLVTANRMHASPMEHVAQSDPHHQHPELHGNFSGFSQYRKQLPGEFIPG